MNDEALLKKLEAAFKLESEERIQNISSGLIKLENTDDPKKEKLFLKLFSGKPTLLKEPPGLLTSLILRFYATALKVYLLY